ncbi:MAG TPA: acyloxyacyl hydrolase [Bacteroidales bacterium]|nr:acyloxyacyl hydrolase [Bacteroidales bacterium]HPO65141.1 acyloxyacyl hydrolase [Bacteroidales bacterium]
MHEVVHKKRICSLILLLNVYLFVSADTIEYNPFYLGVRTYYGFIIPHSESIRSISYSRPRGVGIEAGWIALGQRVWDHCFCYPRVGFNFYFTDFNNHDILGRAYAMLFYVEPSFTVLRRMYLSYRFGMGIAFMDTPYDSIRNPRNLFYSTYLSFPLQAAISLNVRVTDRFVFRLGFHYEHISNGGLKQPNKGINYPTAGIGVNYLVDKLMVPTRDKISHTLYPDFFQMNLVLSGTAKTIANNESSRYFIYGLLLEVQKKIARINALSVGTDVTIDYSLKETLRRANLNDDYKRVGILTGHNLLIGRIVFYQKLGVYVYSPYKAKDPVYQRYGLLYRTTKNTSIGIDLKAHRHVADFLDVRLAYHFALTK